MHDEFHFDICNLEINSIFFTSNIQRHLRVLSQEADRWRRGRRKTAAWHIADAPRSGGGWPGDSNEDIFPSENLLDKWWNNFWRKVLDNLLVYRAFSCHIDLLRCFSFFQSLGSLAFAAWLKWWETDIWTFKSQAQLSEASIFTQKRSWGQEARFGHAFFFFQCSLSLWWECKFLCFF